MASKNSINRVILAGRVGRDPEIRTTKGESPTKYAYFSLCTEEVFSGGGSRIDWHDITSWGTKRAEFVENHVVKGVMLYVEGKLVKNIWTDKDGIKRSAVSIRAESLGFLCPEDARRIKEKKQAQEEQEEDVFGKPEEDEEDFF